MKKAVVEKEENNEPGCFSGRLEAPTTSFHRRRLLLYHQAPVPRFTKACFPEVAKLFKYTPRTLDSGVEMLDLNDAEACVDLTVAWLKK